MQADSAGLEWRSRLSSITRPTRLRDPIEFFASASDVETRALWLSPQTGDALVGIGSACTLVGVGDQRFRQIADAWRKLTRNASIEGNGPLLLGGFSFDPLREPTELWDGFPDARMVVPEQLLSIHNGAASITNSQVADHPIRVHGATHRAARGLPPESWRKLVATVERGIRSEKLGMHKVVLAASCQIRPAHSVEAALRALAAGYPTCTIFAFASGDACFLGATPERLISLHDGSATTMALAGSARRGDTPAEDQRIERELIRDRKEHDEHASVVSALRESLAGVCTSVVVDAAPRVHKLDNVQHLLTIIRGRVTAGRSVLELVEQLHPTPAVGGFPRAQALALIRTREELDRGWYAAPIGWMDRHGDGDFVVGLRSALVRGEAATLFAGCGIVAGSDPPTEYAEWGWKLRPMLSALRTSE